MMEKILLTFFVGLLGYAAGYPTGAPYDACASFTAHHGNHTASDSEVPYEIIVSPENVNAGEIVSVTLRGKDNEKMKGFLIQGIDSNKTPVGFFKPLQGKAQTLNCTSSSNAATHVDRSDKQSVTLEWEAPQAFSGQVNFRAVVVKTYQLFWNNVRSENPLNVS